MNRGEKEISSLVTGTSSCIRKPKLVTSPSGACWEEEVRGVGSRGRSWEAALPCSHLQDQLEEEAEGTCHPFRVSLLAVVGLLVTLVAASAELVGSG